MRHENENAGVVRFQGKLPFAIVATLVLGGIGTGVKLYSDLSRDILTSRAEATRESSHRNERHDADFVRVNDRIIAAEKEIAAANARFEAHVKAQAEMVEGLQKQLDRRFDVVERGMSEIKTMLRDHVSIDKPKG